MHFSWKYQSDITIHQDYLKNTKNLFSSFYSVCEGSSFFPCVCHTYAVRHTTFSILWCHFECDYHHTLNEGSSKSSDQQLQINYESNFSQINSYWSNNVRSSMFDRSKPKIRCLSSITNRWTCSNLFDVQKSYVRVSSKSNLVNLVKAILGSKFDVWSFEAKNWVFQSDHQ